MKIRIIGISGSGKSYLARKIKEILKISHYDMDEFFWDNSGNNYNVKRPKEERFDLLEQALKNDQWIIEGVYFEWGEQTFVQADKIILLKVPFKKCKRRIIKRFFRRKLKIEKGRNESLKSVRELISWAEEFYKTSMPKIETMLENFKEKVVILQNEKEVESFLNSLQN